MNSSADDHDEALRQKVLLDSLKKQKFNPQPIATYICQATKMPNLTTLANQRNGCFGDMPDAWSLMGERTIGVDAGSVGPNEQEFQFQLSNLDKEAQKKSCLIGSERTRLLDEPQLPESKWWVNPFNSTDRRPGDLEHVSVVSCTARHQWSSLPINVDTRLNFYHTGIDQIQELEKRDTMLAAGGATKGAYMTISATRPDGEPIQCTPITTLHFGPTNPAFTRTMALVNASNLENGVIQIPHDVCLAAGLPVYKGVPVPTEDMLEKLLERMDLNEEDNREEIKSSLVQARTRNWEENTKDMERIECFYAIPIMHVLAWVLHSEDFAHQHRVQSEMLRFMPRGSDQPIVLYYLVADVYYRSMVKDFLDPDIGWMNKVDARPLNQIAFEFLPALERERYPNLPATVDAVSGKVVLRSYLTYWMPPAGLTEAEIATLAPTLAPGFRSSQDWVGERQRMDAAVDRYLQN
jgi:hypothetical protein